MRGLGKGMRREDVTFYRSLEKNLYLLFLLIIFGSLCAFSSKVGYDKYGFGDFRVFICIFGVLLIGVLAIFVFVKLFDREPVLNFLDKGLLAPDVTPEVIGWQDILDVRVVTYKGESFVELILSPTAKASLPFTKINRFSRSDFIRSINRALKFEYDYDGVFLNTFGLELPADQIANLLVERIEHSRSNGRPPS